MHKNPAQDFVPFLTTYWRSSDHPDKAELNGLTKIIFIPPSDLLCFGYCNEDSDFKEFESAAMGLSSPTMVSTVRKNFLHYRTSLIWRWSECIKFQWADGVTKSLFELDRDADRMASIPAFLSPHYYLTRAREIIWDKKIETFRAGWGSSLSRSSLAADSSFRDRDDFEHFQFWSVIFQVLTCARNRKKERGDLALEVSFQGSDRSWPLADIQGIHSVHPLMRVEPMKEKFAHAELRYLVEPSFRVENQCLYLFSSFQLPDGLQFSWLKRKFAALWVKTESSVISERPYFVVASGEVPEKDSAHLSALAEVQLVKTSVFSSNHWALEIETQKEIVTLKTGPQERPVPIFYSELLEIIEKERQSRRLPENSLKLLLAAIELGIQESLRTGAPVPVTAASKAANAAQNPLGFLPVARDFHRFLPDQTIFYSKQSEVPFLYVLRAIVSFYIFRDAEAFKGAPVLEELIQALNAWAETGQCEMRGTSPNWPLSLLDIESEEFKIQLNGEALLQGLASLEMNFFAEGSGGWFDLNPKIFFNGELVTPEEIQLMKGDFVEYRGKYFRIDKSLRPTLQSLVRFWKSVLTKRGVAGGTKAATPDRIYRLPRSQVLELLSLRAQGIDIKGNQDWLEICDYFDNSLGLANTSKGPIWNGVMSSQLLDYQKAGAQFLYDLYQLRLGALLADEMGLGKTFQTLAFLQALFTQGRLGEVLIVVPTSVLSNWLEERNRFAPDLPLQILRADQINKFLESATDKAANQIYVISYGAMVEQKQRLSERQWNVVIYDEAQYLKNIYSQRTTTARQIQSKFKVALTGTPLENNLFEFYSICDLLVPGCLGEPSEFRKDYLSADADQNSINRLRQITRPLVFRRTKTQVKLNLPTKHIHQVPIAFDDEQLELYKKTALAFTEQVDRVAAAEGEGRAQMTMLTALTRLRQICSDPAGVPGVNYKRTSPKIQFVGQACQEILEDQQSVLIFTQFLKTLERTIESLRSQGLPVLSIQGNMSSQARIETLNKFRESSSPQILVMTLKTGGVGLNLTKASYVYHLEPWWNPAVENQASDRVHRLGQTQDVNINNLLMEGSLEERIRNLKIKKQEIFDSLFTPAETENDALENSRSGGLSVEDFRYLLKQD